MLKFFTEFIYLFIWTRTIALFKENEESTEKTEHDEHEKDDVHIGIGDIRRRLPM